MLDTFSLLPKITRRIHEVAEATKEERATLFAALVAREATEDDLPASAYFIADSGIERA